MKNIFNNKKGLSGVIVTLILILLVLVAIGVVWVVVQNVLESGTGQINLGANCLEIDVKPVSAGCSETGVCNVTLERGGDNGDDIGGVKLTFRNASGETNYIHDVSGNINSLERKTERSITTEIANVTEVVSTIYFTDDSGNEQLCSGGNSLDLS